MPTSSFYKVNQFVEDVGKVLHNLASGGDAIMILLTNTVPNVGDTVVDTSVTPCVVKAVSNAVEIAAGNGYTKKGLQITAQQFIQTTGTAKFYGARPLWTCVTAPMPTFRYAVVYNDTKGTSATRPLIGWFDYGAGITPGVGETFAAGNSNDGTDWTSTYPTFTLA
jgi:hypothetical protein